MHFLPDLHWELCATTATVKDSFGLEIKASQVLGDLSLYDAIIVPGGFGTRNLVDNPQFMAWLTEARKVPLKISVCTGSLLLGAAGFLQGRTATTHFDEYDTLARFCTVDKRQLVHDKDIISAGAVAASLHLGLYLCELWAGPHACKQIQSKMNYFPNQPTPESS